MDSLIKTQDCCIRVFKDEAEQLSEILNNIIDNKNYYLAENIINDLSISELNKDRLLRCVESYKNSC